LISIEEEKNPRSRKDGHKTEPWGRRGTRVL